MPLLGRVLLIETLGYDISVYMEFLPIGLRKVHEMHGQCLVDCLNVSKRVSMCPNLWINTLSATWTNTWSSTRLNIWSNTNPNNFCSNWLSMQLADITKLDFCSLQLLHCKNIQQLGQIRRFFCSDLEKILQLLPPWQTWICAHLIHAHAISMIR